MKFPWTHFGLSVLLSQLVGCGEVVNVQNRVPRVSDLSLCLEDNRLIWLVGIRDAEGDPTDVAIRMNTSDMDGVEALSTGTATVSPGPFGDGLVGLSSGRDGVLRAIEWARCAEDGGACVLPSTIRELAGSSNCTCVRAVEEVAMLPSFTIELRDRSGARSTAAFDTGLRVSSTCPPTLP